MAAKGNVSSTYKRRVARVRGKTALLEAEARNDYELGLQEATLQQLYDRTPLKVTLAMLDSIGSRKIPGGIEVGYNIGNAKRRNVKHVQIRLNMKGRSVLGGHDLTMNPNKFLRNRTDGKVRRRAARIQREILGD